MASADAGRTGGLTRAALHGADERRDWAARGGRVAMGMESADGIPVVVLVAGRLIPVSELDEVQRRSIASLRGRELARKRWAKAGG